MKLLLAHVLQYAVETESTKWIPLLINCCISFCSVLLVTRTKMNEVAAVTLIKNESKEHMNVFVCMWFSLFLHTFAKCSEWNWIDYGKAFSADIAMLMLQHKIQRHTYQECSRRFMTLVGCSCFTYFGIYEWKYQLFVSQIHSQ